MNYLLIFDNSISFTHYTYMFDSDFAFGKLYPGDHKNRLNPIKLYNSI